MLLRNLTDTAQSKGHYKINPGCWGVVPDRVAGSWMNNPSFEPVPPTQGLTVYIYAGCPLETTGGGQHPTQIANALVRAGHRVVYIQNYYQADPDIIVIGDKKMLSVEPATGIELDKHHHLLTSLQPGVVLFTFPSAYCASLATIAKLAGHKTVYWCLDDWTAINVSMGNRRYRSAHEIAMANSVDYLIATARPLAIHVSKITDGKVCRVIPNGYSALNFPFNEFIAPERPFDLTQGHRTLVYWGELGGAWIDWELIEKIAVTFPNWEVNLIGPDNRCDKPVRLPNVHYLGEKKVSDLYAYGVHSDLGLVPFMNDSVSAAVNPIKAYEYLACRLWVMGPASMTELATFPNTFAYASHNEAIEFLLSFDFQKAPMTSTLADFLESSTWDARSNEFLEVTQCHSLLKTPLQI